MNARLRRPTWKLLAGVLLLAGLSAGVWVLWAYWHPPTVSGAFPQEAYVWQRVWTEDVQAVVSEPPPCIGRLVVLAAETRYNADGWRTVRVGLDYAAMKASGRAIGLAIRIGPYSGPFQRDDATGRHLADLARSLLTEAKAAGIEPAELQIDFDCATSRLDGYRTWVGMFQTALPHGPAITITALPTWLRSSEFPALAEATDGYVLQVHSFERPTAGQALTLCDPAAARRAISKAGRIGVPFRVALPTYGYVVAFGADGEFLGLAAEGPRPDWPADADVRTVRANPKALAELVRDWTRERPEAMHGVIWYRLPVASDRLNWRPATLEAVAEGRVPLPAVGVDVQPDGEGLFDIALTNTGEAGGFGPRRIEITHGEVRRIAADALGKASYHARPTSTILILDDPLWVRPEESIPVGWLRLAHDTEVMIHAQQ